MALKDDFQFDTGTYGYDDEDDEWGDDEATWTAGDDVEEEETSDAKDESTAYLEFLNEEVKFPFLPVPTLQPTPTFLDHPPPVCKLADSGTTQAQKFGAAQESDDELGEDSVLLESPLDKIEPYQLFRASLMSEYPYLPRASFQREGPWDQI